jgi:hypothetical protein
VFASCAPHPLATALAMGGAPTRSLLRNSNFMLGTHIAVSSLHSLLRFAVLWPDQVYSKHLAQVLIAQPLGDSGLEEPERFAGHEIDALLVPCSQRARKRRQRQLAQLRSATNVAAEADLQPVTALGKPAAISTQVSVRFDSPCSVAVLCRRPTVCRSTALPSYSAFAHVQAAVHEGGVSCANPDAVIESGPSDSGVPTQHRCERLYVHDANSIAAIRYSLQQHAIYNVRISTRSLQTCAEQHARSATFNMQQTNMVAAMQRMTRFPSHFGPYVDCVFGTP